MSSPSSSINSRKWVLGFLPILLPFIIISSFTLAASSSSASNYLNHVIANTTVLHRNFTAISEFRTINRRRLEQGNSEDSIQITVAPNSSLSDDGFVSGVSSPSDGDWVDMISPSNLSVKGCVWDKFYYFFTGDNASLPVLCHYPVKLGLKHADMEKLFSSRHHSLKMHRAQAVGIEPNPAAHPSYLPNLSSPRPKTHTHHPLHLPISRNTISPKFPKSIHF